jgi:hypothetical protein
MCATLFQCSRPQIGSELGHGLRTHMNRQRVPVQRSVKIGITIPLEALTRRASILILFRTCLPLQSAGGDKRRP